VCRKTFFGPHFSYSFVENEDILVAIGIIVEKMKPKGENEA